MASSDARLGREVPVRDGDVIDEKEKSVILCAPHPLYVLSIFSSWRLQTPSTVPIAFLLLAFCTFSPVRARNPPRQMQRTADALSCVGRQKAANGEEAAREDAVG